MENTQSSTSELKLQPQSGLGDIINALPTIEIAVNQNIKITIATNHRYVLSPFGESVNTVPVEFSGIMPILNEGFTHLRYDRYSPETYTKRYFYNVFPDGNYTTALHRVRARFSAMAFCAEQFIWVLKNPNQKYVVFAPPRAAARHKKVTDPFQCAPHPPEAVSHARKGLPVIMVGYNDLYDPSDTTPPDFIDARDKLSFESLCSLIMGASAVVSQVSAITAIAGLYGVPTDFLRARTETEEQHQKHIAGVIWQGQEIL